MIALLITVPHSTAHMLIPAVTILYYTVLYYTTESDIQYYTSHTKYSIVSDIL